jgi:hypothetical protein
MRAGPAKPSGRGGIKRKLKQNISTAVAALPQPAGLIEAPEPEDSLEVKNSCPKCKTVHKATDVYCRKDGTKLCVGKPCERCGVPCEEADAFCWGCGWKLGETVPPPPQPSPLPRPGLSLTPTVDLPPGAEEIMNGQPGSVEVLAAESSPPPAEDPILRLRRLAQEQGYLPKETVVASH